MTVLPISFDQRLYGLLFCIRILGKCHHAGALCEELLSKEKQIFYLGLGVYNMKTSSYVIYIPKVKRAEARIARLPRL